MVVAAVAAVYGLIVTVALAVSCVSGPTRPPRLRLHALVDPASPSPPLPTHQVRLRLVDSEGEYMNTKPPAPRAHWRKS